MFLQGSYVALLSWRNSRVGSTWFRYSMSDHDVAWAGTIPMWDSTWSWYSMSDHGVARSDLFGDLFKLKPEVRSAIDLAIFAMVIFHRSRYFVDRDLRDRDLAIVIFCRSRHFVDRDLRNLDLPIVIFRRSRFTWSSYFSWSRVRTPDQTVRSFYWSWVRFPGQIACFRPVWFMAYVNQ